jgi:hypothetical protein
MRVVEGKENPKKASEAGNLDERDRLLAELQGMN